ncbi:MAG: sigma-70 family RNA polymerase sigma factor [Pirellulales bacterium]
MDSSHPSFATTQWTLVWKAAEEDSSHGRPALTAIIERYWMPLYGYARRQGLSQADAEDATQEFLIDMMEGDYLSKVDPAKGRFRSYLLTLWKRYLVDVYRKENRQKRGGHLKKWSFDIPLGETSIHESLYGSDNPDQGFTEQWALALIDDTKKRLAQEYRSKDRLRLFEALQGYLTCPLDQLACNQLAKDMGLSPSNIKVALHRLREKFGKTLREAILETVEDPNDIESELQTMLEALSRKL